MGPDTPTDSPEKGNADTSCELTQNNGNTLTLTVPKEPSCGVNGLLEGVCGVAVEEQGAIKQQGWSWILKTIDQRLYNIIHDTSDRETMDNVTMALSISNLSDAIQFLTRSTFHDRILYQKSQQVNSAINTVLNELSFGNHQNGVHLHREPETIGYANSLLIKSVKQLIQETRKWNIGFKPLDLEDGDECALETQLTSSSSSESEENGNKQMVMSLNRTMRCISMLIVLVDPTYRLNKYSVAQVIRRTSEILVSVGDFLELIQQMALSPQHTPDLEIGRAHV